MDTTDYPPPQGRKEGGREGGREEGREGGREDWKWIPLTTPPPPKKKKKFHCLGSTLV